MRLSLLLLLALALPAQSQEAARVDGLRPQARAAAERGADVLALLTQLRGGLRVDAERSVVRGDYAPPAFSVAASDAETAARTYLEQFSERYGLRSDLADLRATRVTEGRYDQHVTFEQTITAGGETLPVFGRQVQVSMTADGRVLLVQSGYEPVVDVSGGAWNDDLARRRAAALVEGARVAELRRVVMPVGPDRPAQKAYLAGVIGADEWAFVIGLDGAPLFAAPRTAHHAHTMDARASAFGFSQGAAVGPVAAQTDGSGLVFDPDPLTTAGVAYGGAYVDAGDADSAELNAQRIEVALPGITQRGGKWRLEGPYVAIDGTLGSSYTPPAETDPHAFRYTRADDRFEAVMVYHHVNADQRRVQALGVGRPILEQPIRVNPHGDLSDNSRFFTSDLTIRMGIGGVDDAEDAMVIRHEYAHALLNADAPALYQRQDGSALHEGWADYWAAGWRASLIQSGQGSGDVRKVFPWDGNNGCWQGRKLDHPGRYPSDTGYPPPGGGCGNFPTIYQRGLLWATTLFDLRLVIGADVMDRLVVASHAFVGNVPGVPAFESAAQALLAADVALYDGRHRQTLAIGLSERGYVDPSEAGPDLVFTPLGPSEQSNGVRRIVASVRPASASVRLVIVRGVNLADTVALAPVGVPDASGFQRVEGDLPIPRFATTLRYALVATDDAGRSRWLPDLTSSGERYYSVQTGPDQEPPVVSHTPADAVPASAWPLTLFVQAGDRMGVASVSARVLLTSRGQTLLDDTLAMTRADGDRWRLTLPLLSQAPTPGDVLSYAFSATDSSNIPDTSPFDLVYTTVLVNQGDLVRYDFEAPMSPFSGDTPWALLQRDGRARSGWGLWAAETDTVGISALDVPVIDVPPGGAWLAFWHRYRIAAGSGAYVEVRDSDTQQWQRLTPSVTDYGAPSGPIDGYPAAIGDQGAWSGDSKGWQRAAFRLPIRSGLRVRLVLASGRSGDEWLIDDLTVSTDSLRDASPPTVERVAGGRVRAAGRGALDFAVDVSDDLGVAAVYVDAQTDAGAVRWRLNQTRVNESAATFAGSLPDSLFARLGFSAAGPRAGDALRYAFEVVDVAGRIVREPAVSPLTLDFRTLSEQDMLASAQALGAWGPANPAGYIVRSQADEPVSTLLFAPLSLPGNADVSELRVEQTFDLRSGGAAQFGLSADRGPWQPLIPQGGYSDTLRLAGHPMNGEPVWTGFAAPGEVVRFNLLPWAGQTVRLRARMAHGEGRGSWIIASADRLFATSSDLFDGPSALRLDLPAPHPIRGRATVIYTVPQEGRVTMEMFDLLGRRVALLVDGEQRAAAAHTQTLDTSRLAAGVYLLRLESQGRSEVRRVVVL